ncbi:hypothetical protein Nepgr_021185 [Nepenthes gracilis]|uniref:Import inner membrane translocase subunit n=1 Tax=Nepenthes gracilis TaxID=150966 RepID=A0AAD3SY86_NEPGR|nr:hypothetical protein Nepgr_021185 [Nepenthes gracilis]
MSKPVPRIVRGFFRFHFDRNQSHFPSNPTPSFISDRGCSSILSYGFSNSAIFASETDTNRSFQFLISRAASSNGVLRLMLNCPSSFLGISCRNYSSTSLKFNDVSCKSWGFGKLCYNPLRVRYLSFGSPSFGSKITGSVAQKVVEKPLSAVKSAASRYREAVALQIEGFWRRNYLLLVGAGGVAVCILLYRIMFGIANTFVGLSEGMAKYGFLALSSAMVAFAGLYIRSRYTINPDKVYRIAMRMLNTSAGVLEVMGAPLSGTDLRAYVMSGGGFTMSKLKPRFRSKRCFLIFPIHGSERKGLVSAEVKKQKGEYIMKLLAVDIPMASGPDKRLFIAGDEEEYRVGGGLIAELRDPVVKAMAATKEFEELDDVEEEKHAERQLQEAERKHREDAYKAERERAQ